MSEITEVIVTQYHIDGRVFDSKEEAEAYLFCCRYENSVAVLREEVSHSRILDPRFNINDKLFIQREFAQLHNIKEKIERFLKVVQNVEEA